MERLPQGYARFTLSRKDGEVVTSYAEAMPFYLLPLTVLSLFFLWTSPTFFP